MSDLGSAPTSGTWVGHDPAVLASLANERNSLAWQRTALSWLGAGGAVARYFSGDGLLSARVAIGWLMLGVGAMIWFDGSRRHHRHGSSIRDNTPTAPPFRMFRVLAVVTTLVILAIVVIEIVTW